MARMTMNISSEDAARADRSLIPEGTYLCQIVKVEKVHPKQGPNVDKWMYSIQARILEGEKKGRLAFVNVSLWHEARYTLLDLLGAMGETIAEGELEIPEEHEIQDLTVEMRCKHRTYQDALQADWKFVPTPPGGAAAPGSKPSTGKTKLPLRGGKTALPKAAS